MQIIPIATRATRLVLTKHAEQALMELRSNLVWEMEKSQQNTQIELCVTCIHHQKLFLKLKLFYYMVLTDDLGNNRCASDRSAFRAVTWSSE